MEQIYELRLSGNNQIELKFCLTHSPYDTSFQEGDLVANWWVLWREGSQNEKGKWRLLLQVA